jgi:hypothetical protein
MMLPGGDGGDDEPTAATLAGNFPEEHEMVGDLMPILASRAHQGSMDVRTSTSNDQALGGWLWRNA